MITGLTGSFHSSEFIRPFSIKRTYFCLDYLKQYLNGTGHVSKEAAQLPKQQRVNSNSRHKSLPARSPHGSLTLTPGASAQSSVTQCWQQSVAQQCSPVWDLKANLYPFLSRPGSHWDKVASEAGFQSGCSWATLRVFFELREWDLSLPTFL